MHTFSISTLFFDVFSALRLDEHKQYHTFFFANESTVTVLPCRSMKTEGAAEAAVTPKVESMSNNNAA